MKRIVLSIVRLYQRIVSPFLVSILGSHCRFSPTCSVYMYQAIEKHGIIYGLWLGVGRVLRCNPFSKGGLDPVK